MKSIKERILEAKEGNWNSDFPEFSPDFTPVQMVKKGIFGGNYFGKNIGSFQKNVPKNFTKHFSTKEINDKLTNKEHRKSKNKYGVECGSDYEYWKKKGWLTKNDPFGWFNWYINFYYGRRCEDDKWQIGRWKSFKGRHTGILKSNCSPKKDVGCEKTRQNMLHWAIDSTKV